MIRHSNGCTLEYLDLITGVDLKTTNPGASAIVDLSGNGLAIDAVMVATFTATGSNATVGTAKIQVERFALDGTTILLPITDIVTGIILPVTATTTYLYLLFTPSRAPRRIGTVPTATIVTTHSDFFCCLGKTRFTMVATTASDAGTACTGSLYLRTSA
jgi:hypothetical protein